MPFTLFPRRKAIIDISEVITEMKNIFISNIYNFVASIHIRVVTLFSLSNFLQLNLSLLILRYFFINFLFHFHQQSQYLK